MPEIAGRNERGFTLIEMIIAMVITGIVAGMIAAFMVAPMRGYIDAVRRADLSDVTDTALRRIAYDLRAAVPNTVRVDATNRFLEFVPAADGGRYRTQPTSAGGGDILDGTSAADAAFDVLGPAVTGAAGDFVVIFNTGQAGLNIYANANCTIQGNCRVLSAAAGAAVNFTAIALSPFPPFESPAQRFQLVAATGPQTFACTGVGTSAAGNGTGQLRRHIGYGFNAAQLTAGLGAGVLLAENLSACDFGYTPLSAASGLVILQLTVTRDIESVTLHHEIHVDNAP